MKPCRLNWIFFLFVFVFLLSSPVYAQIPFYTDDADITKKGKFHFEFFNAHDWLQKTASSANLFGEWSPKDALRRGISWMK